MLVGHLRARAARFRRQLCPVATGFEDRSNRGAAVRVSVSARTMSGYFDAPLRQLMMSLGYQRPTNASKTKRPASKRPKGRVTNAIPRFDERSATNLANAPDDAANTRCFGQYRYRLADENRPSHSERPIVRAHQPPSPTIYGHTGARADASPEHGTDHHPHHTTAAPLQNRATRPRGRDNARRHGRMTSSRAARDRRRHDQARFARVTVSAKRLIAPLRKERTQQNKSTRPDEPHRI